MLSPESYRVFTRKFEAIGLKYAVTGSLAAVYYGEPRLTNDVDVILLIERHKATAFTTAFPAAEFYCPPPEVIEIECARPQRGHFNLIHHESGFRADIYLAGGDELHAWALRNVELADLGSDTVRFAPPEYVIIRKLQFYKEGKSEKHLRDINRMLVGLGDDWPRSTLLKFIAAYHLETEWEKAQ